MSVEEIVAEWEQLSPAHVLGALTYYHENREEIDQIRQSNSYERWLAEHAYTPVSTDKNTS